MSLVLDLPADLETELSSEAEQLGLGLPEYVVRLLAAGRAQGKAPRTGAELVAYWQREGLIGARPDILDSQSRARHVRERSQRRRRA